MVGDLAFSMFFTVAFSVLFGLAFSLPFGLVFSRPLGLVFSSRVGDGVGDGFGEGRGGKVLGQFGSGELSFSVTFSVGEVDGFRTVGLDGFILCVGVVGLVLDPLVTLACSRSVLVRLLEILVFSRRVGDGEDDDFGEGSGGNVVGQFGSGERSFSVTFSVGGVDGFRTVSLDGFILCFGVVGLVLDPLVPLPCSRSVLVRLLELLLSVPSNGVWEAGFSFEGSVVLLKLALALRWELVRPCPP